MVLVQVRLLPSSLPQGEAESQCQKIEIVASYIVYLLHPEDEHIRLYSKGRLSVHSVNKTTTQINSEYDIMKSSDKHVLILF